MESGMSFVQPAINAWLLFWARLVVRVRRPLIVGVTGSVGKTTTKEVIAAALKHPEVQERVGRVVATPRNMNNTRGVPLVVLGYTRSPQSRRETAAWMLGAPLRALALATVKPFPSVLVLEFAAGPKGDIQRTAAAAPPTVAVVTAIGPAHLEQFGTLERVVHEKGALVRAVSPSGLVVLGAASAPVAALERQSAAPVVKIEGRGRALSENAARAVCDFLGIPREVTERALAAAPAVPGRLNVLELGLFTVIDDSYNANPLSMQLGLDTLAGRAGPGTRRVAVLGDMKELGQEATRYHDEIAEYARPCAEVIIGVGPLARHYRPDHWFATSDECAEALPSLIAPGDCLLVKGSNSVGLDKVVRAARRIAGDPNLPAGVDDTRSVDLPASAQ